MTLLVLLLLLINFVTVDLPTNTILGSVILHKTITVRNRRNHASLSIVIIYVFVILFGTLCVTLMIIKHLYFDIANV